MAEEERTSPTAGDVIQAARDLHSAFDKQSSPSKVVRRHLQRTARQLVERLTNIWPDPLMVGEQEIVLPLTDFVRGEELEPGLYYEGGRVYWTGNTSDELHLVGRKVLATPPPSAWPCAAIVGGHIYLGRTESQWETAERATVLYVPYLDDLTGDDSTFSPLPDYADSPLVAEAALLMARRARDVDAGPFYDDRNDAVKTFLETATSQRRANRGKTRRVF